jgi:hypothetical protein
MRQPDKLDDTQVQLNSVRLPDSKRLLRYVSPQLPHVQQPQPHEAARQARGYAGTLVLITQSSSLNPRERLPDKLEDMQVC